MVIDIIVLIILFISAGVAFLRGFIRETLTIAGIGGGLAAAYAVAPVLSVHVREWIGANPAEGEEVKKLFDMIPYTIVADIMSYGGVFIVVTIILSVISHYLAEGARKIGMGAIDRTLGVIFGLVRGVVLLGLLYLPLYALVDKDTRDGWFEGSQTHFYIEQTAKTLTGFLPKGSGLNPETDDDAAGGEQSNETRETLEKINLLNSAADMVKQQQQKANSPASGLNAPAQDGASGTKESGYSDEFRSDMNDLINQQRDAERAARQNDQNSN